MTVIDGTKEHFADLPVPRSHHTRRPSPIDNLVIMLCLAVIVLSLAKSEERGQKARG